MRLNKDKVKRRFESSLKTYDASALVQEEVSSKLLSLVEQHQLTPVHTVFEMGCGTGLLTRKLIRAFQGSRFYCNDISPLVKPYIDQLFSSQHHDQYTYCFGDIETCQFPQACDLVIASSVFQWVEDFEAFSTKLSTSMDSKGVLAFSTYGDKNFQEIASLRADLQYLRAERIVGLLEASGFELLEVREEQIRLAFDSQKELLTHLKLTGTTGGAEHQTFGALRSLLSRSPTKSTLTYHPIYIIARKV